MSARLPDLITVTRRFKAPAERVFDAWLDAGKMKKCFASPGGKGTPGRMVSVAIDARVGGSFSFVEARDGREIAHTGEYLEIDPPRLLVFTFTAERQPPDDARIVIEILPSRSGCELTLAHVGVRPNHAKRAEADWVGILDALAGSLDHGSARQTPRPGRK
jgi:uncharacterized protein YndB with AHSA1/START domain